MNYNRYIKFFSLLVILFVITSCHDQFEEFPKNPNVAGDEASVPPGTILRTVLFDVSRGGGVVDLRPGNVIEEPFNLISRLNQYTTGLTFPLYGGSNAYNWTNTATMYNNIKNLRKMEEMAEKTHGSTNNPFLAVSKFLRAYSFLWLTQRVGDIPMDEAGLGLDNMTPAFNTQKEVYQKSLAMLEEANAELAAIISATTLVKLDGDIFFNGDLKKWQKAVNAYHLRTLLSLSKRADDTPDLKIKEKFQEIITNKEKYPLLAANADNMNFKYVPVQNRYPVQFLRLYSTQTTVSETVLKITRETEDPRTFVFATPAPDQITKGLTYKDFAAYIGTQNGVPQNILNNDAQKGMYSYINYIRYLNNTLDNAPEPYIIVGYPEQCFNIAEGINRGWATGEAATHYTNGIKASLEFFGVTEGRSVSIGNVTGVSYGTLNYNVKAFLEHPEVVYKGDNAEGLSQILKQKYVSMWQNSGWEPFYNFRRTGVPQFSQGVGTNAEGKIPMRWAYPIDEVNNNPNAAEAIGRQYGGDDDVFGVMWLLK